LSDAGEADPVRSSQQVAELNDLALRLWDGGA
jgi:hypothetical protein